MPEIHRLRGVFLRSLGSPAEEVERTLCTALEIAEEQGALLLKLRAATSLARLWLDQGKPQQARELLTPVYCWFTEGFDTLELKEAKALLEQTHIVSEIRSSLDGIGLAQYGAESVDRLGIVLLIGTLHPFLGACRYRNRLST